MKYRMLAVDLDGTLLNRQGQVSSSNLDAVQRAIEAGLRIVPCTGRAWCECRDVLANFPVSPLSDTGVFVTGAAISDLTTGKTLDTNAIEPHLVLDLVEHLWDLPEAILVFRDGNHVHHDYLVTGSGSLAPNTQWWFDRTGAKVHRLDRVGIDDLHHTLRVGLVAIGHRIPPTLDGVRQSFAGQVEIQHFQAVQTPDPDQIVHILEVFAAGVDKWRGLTWIAQKQGIEPEQIAAIGDEINDVSMLQHVGCGIAMDGAADVTRAVARHVTLGCDDHGVAHAINMLLEGKWG